MITLTVPQMKALLRAGNEVLAGENDWPARTLQALENGMAALNSAVQTDERATRRLKDR